MHLITTEITPDGVSQRIDTYSVKQDLPLHTRFFKITNPDDRCPDYGVKMDRFGLPRRLSISGVKTEKYHLWFPDESTTDAMVLLMNSFIFEDLRHRANRIQSMRIQMEKFTGHNPVPAALARRKEAAVVIEGHLQTIQSLRSGLDECKNQLAAAQNGLSEDEVIDFMYWFDEMPYTNVKSGFRQLDTNEQIPTSEVIQHFRQQDKAGQEAPKK